MTECLISRECVAMPIMEMPTSCKVCRFLNWHGKAGLWSCEIRAAYIDDEEQTKVWDGASRANNCPLRPYRYGRV